MMYIESVDSEWQRLLRFGRLHLRRVVAHCVAAIELRIRIRMYALVTLKNPKRSSLGLYYTLGIKFRDTYG